METRPSRLLDLIAAVPDLALGGVFLVAWIQPTLIGVERIREGLLLMLIEFIVIHSAAFMGTAAWGDRRPGKKATFVIGLGLFYTLFVGGFALAFSTWWPLAAFWGLTFNRLLGALIGQGEGEERLLVQRGWAASTLFYLMAVFSTVFIPYPRLGMTPEVLDLVDLPGSGLWIDRPWSVMAAGFIYFTACGLSELSGHGWLKGGSREPVADSRGTGSR